MMSIKRKAFVGGVWLAGFNAISQAFSWVATILVARILIPEDYGLMAMATLLTEYVVLFSENTILNNDYGFSLSGSSYNRILDCNISYNREYGVWLGASSNNVLVNNDVKENKRSLHVEASEGNMIYHNNFINVATEQHPVNIDSKNSWDNGVEGNFWSLHEKTDEDQDGICDVVYVIDGERWL